METAKIGNTVKVHYTGKLDDGMIFDSSRERDPIEFTIGNGDLIKGFEDAVVGMSVGNEKTVKIPSIEAYGAYRDELTITVDKAKFPSDIEPKVGHCLNLRRPDGGALDVVIISVQEDTVTLDANHPLAGKELTFEIELMEII